MSLSISLPRLLEFLSCPLGDIVIWDVDCLFINPLKLWNCNELGNEEVACLGEMYRLFTNFCLFDPFVRLGLRTRLNF